MPDPKTPQQTEYAPRFPGSNYSDGTPRAFVAVHDEKGRPLGHAWISVQDADTLYFDASTGSRGPDGQALGLTYRGSRYSASGHYERQGAAWVEYGRGPRISRYPFQDAPPSYRRTLAAAMLRTVNEHAPSDAARDEAQARKLREEADHWREVREASRQLAEHVVAAEAALGRGDVPPRLYVTELRASLREYAA